ncbi:hypothetical protein QBC37DRAFT_245793, partial [Rhypophila decipiens]
DGTSRHLLEGSRAVVALKTVSRFWGEDKVQHYRWAERGESYCNKLCTAAREVKGWDEAVVKLNRLIHSRARQLRVGGVKVSVNSIEPQDLISLRVWSHKDTYTRKVDEREIVLPFRELAATDLPAGFCFDRFGLLIRMEEQRPESVPEGGVMIDGVVSEWSQQVQRPRK